MNYKTLGIDIGSTTVKIAILDENENLIFADYKRHFANIQETLADLLQEAFDQYGEMTLHPVITGSGGLTLANHLGVPFTQEVIAVSTSLQKLAPKTDVAIELGGEDAKIIYFENGNVEQRMNGICAGGTGSFIDQMASLLQTDATGLNEYAKDYKALYPIAARCGVFAKTDIQPLINDGATKPDLSASIFQAVVNQTISGLACGKPIRGHVAFLGGPLHFLSELRESFIRTLKLDEEHTIIPENSHLFAAIGSALNAKEDNSISLTEMKDRLRNSIKLDFEVERMEPLFASQEEYDAFAKRQSSYKVKTGDLATYKGNCYLGIDAGSTTTKTALVGEDGTLLYSFYSSNNGNPLKTTIRSIKEIYELLPEDAKIAYSCSTGYGEALIKAALILDEGEVETVSHYYAAAFFDPEVDCILDIGGQDMKCIKIRNKTVDSVQLNEACSSGCGSFIETFAKSLNYTVQDFAKAAVFAQHPIDLGTRCTVFMNSKVKQAQKEGAEVSDISAGLAYSVIKNALYKVIRTSSASELGKKIVVQGGTFLNDAVLRVFEKETGREVIRPCISGLMGAYGAALYAMNKCKGEGKSTIIKREALNGFFHKIVTTNCGLCNNNCRLTVNTFSDGKRYIAGNRCERPITKKSPDNSFNIYEYKRNLLDSYKPVKGSRGKIGIPMGLNMFELLPFWHTFFTKLGFEVVRSPYSTRKLYLSGQHTIPSDTVCFPAKLMHGHVQWLIDNGIKTIFYPCMSYNFDEHMGDNHYNCPVVAYYPEVIHANVRDIEKVTFFYEYLGIHRRKEFPYKMHEHLEKYFGKIDVKEVKAAARAAYDEYESYLAKIRTYGEDIIKRAEKENKPIFVLCGRPYHADPEINHGIDRMIASFNVAIISEDVVSNKVDKFPTTVLNQWTYHSRLYSAARYVSTKPNMNLVQLVSFGCGVDAITTDEVRGILEQKGKIYTQIKIDEITNLGAVKIRIRSLLATLDEN